LCIQTLIYVTEPYPLAAYQTIFARVPGSAEMPSAGRPFTKRVIQSLRQRGIKVAGITLHTGVSSLEIETETVEAHPMYAEPFEVPIATARLVNATREAGHRVIAVGTTVVRALESAWDGEAVRPTRGFTRLFVHPQRGVHVVDGLITGFHDPLASHLAMLYSVAGQAVVQDSYREAVEHGYLWHEFGDSHLLLKQ
jgi:S-adenosylmethionine:tRNA ribosyltransferase-isomerase